MVKTLVFVKPFKQVDHMLHVTKSLNDLEIIKEALRF